MATRKRRSTPIVHLDRYTRKGLMKLIYERIDEMAREMQDSIDRMRASVEKTQGIAESVKKVITDMAQNMRDNADDPDEINALADKLDETAAGLASAVQANPAPPAETPVDTPPSSEPGSGEGDAGNAPGGPADVGASGGQDNT